MPALLRYTKTKRCLLSAMPAGTKALILFCCMASFIFPCHAQLLQGFKETGTFNEQEMTLNKTWENVIISINAPLLFNPKAKTYLAFYALPNGNSIEWTKGKKMNPGDDWHFNIQHIAAQTRYVRNVDRKNNYITVYTMAEQKNWPAWKRSTPDSIYLIKKIVDSITNIFAAYDPAIVLSSHSGGGSFIFGFHDAVEKIPVKIESIAFLDSDYGYDETKHKNKLVAWLNQSKTNKLIVLAYNDSVVIYNGKPLVSPTGGTWYRSRLMQRNLSQYFRFTSDYDTAFIRHRALHNRIQFILKENPGGLIYHTEQVARNGFILSLFAATKFNRKKHFAYFGKPVYDDFIND
jgi:hypothetical protein